MALELEKLQTWDDLQNYLLERLDMAADEQSNANKSFTKKDHWNSLLEQTMKYSGDALPVRTKDLLIKSIKKDFK